MLVLLGFRVWGFGGLGYRGYGAFRVPERDLQGFQGCYKGLGFRVLGILLKGSIGVPIRATTGFRL